MGEVALRRPEKNRELAAFLRGPFALTVSSSRRAPPSSRWYQYQDNQCLGTWIKTAAG